MQVLAAVTALDVASARAKHASWLGAVAPRLLRPAEVADRGCVCVRGMRHPLLLERALPPLLQAPIAADIDFATSHLSLLGPPPGPPGWQVGEATTVRWLLM